MILVSTIDRTANSFKNTTLGGAADTKIIANKGLYLTTATADPTAGVAGQSLVIKGFYVIIDIP